MKEEEKKGHVLFLEVNIPEIAHIASHISLTRILSHDHATKETEKCSLYLGWLCAELKAGISITIGKRENGYWRQVSK